MCSNFAMEHRSASRLTRIDNDLQALGEPIREQEPLPIDITRSEPLALGAMYVIEGSSLGGKLIAQHLTARGVPGNQCSFFRGDMSDTKRWRDFRKLLNEQLLTQDHLTDAVDGAESMFALFIHELDGRSDVK
jgi:heme oxygenase